MGSPSRANDASARDTRGEGLPAIALAVAIPLGAAAFFALFRDIRLDDAFITYTYARNVGSGEGYVFNPGQRVLGATSPLHALLLSLLWPFAGENLPLVANGLSALALAAQAWLLYLLLRRQAPATAFLFSLLTLAGFNDAAQWFSMETTIMGALVLGTFCALQAGRDRLCGLLLGLAFLCRYDAGLLVPVVALQAWRRSRRPPVTILATSLGVVSPWLLFSQLYFGSVLPNTLAAKWNLLPFREYLSRFLWRTLDYPWRPFGAWAPETATRTISALLWMSGAVFAWRHARHLLGLIVYAAALLIVYAHIGPFAVQGWHVNTVLMTCNLLFVLGIGGWLELRLARARPGASAPRLAAATLGLAFLAAWIVETVGFAGEAREGIWWGGRHHRYSTVSRWVNEHIKDGQRFMANEFGTVGFYTRQFMIDPYGLINPTNSYPRTRSSTSYQKLIRHYEPDLILVDSPEEARETEIRLGYWAVKKFDWDILGSVIVVRDPSVLADPSEFWRLRAELPDLSLPVEPLDYEDP